MNKPVFRLKYSLAGAVYETVGYSGPHFSVITVNDESGVKLTLIPSRPITLISASLEFWHEYEKNEKFFVNVVDNIGRDVRRGYLSRNDSARWCHKIYERYGDNLRRLCVHPL